MTNQDDVKALTDKLTAEVTKLSGAVASSTALISGLNAAYQAEVAALATAQANNQPLDLSGLQAIGAQIDAQAAALADAVAANPIPGGGSTTTSGTSAPSATTKASTPPSAATSAKSPF